MNDQQEPTIILDPSETGEIVDEHSDNNDSDDPEEIIKIDIDEDFRGRKTVDSEILYL